ncbi:MAG: hypothetical protein COA91_04465 [Robiginitomaculum sp.]|nr:MAG: hypothetical protein COA91_04465 [Robiginitomaculum sp.]
MREFSPEFQAHIEGATTSLCWVWKLTRRDDMVLGFTDHDRDLVVDGVSYQAASGFSPSDIDARLGFALDNSAVQGLLSSDVITKADIRAGLYDSAQVEIRRVNWMQPSENGLIWSGKLGDIHMRDGQFEAELVGRAAVLERSTGRVFAKSCDASFADTRCGLDAGNFPGSTTCPRTYEACRQFQNTTNFRGFPYLIGEDAAFSAPRATDTKDGSSRYS